MPCTAESLIFMMSYEQAVVLYPPHHILAELEKILTVNDLAQLVIDYTNDFSLLKLIQSLHDMARLREQCDAILCHHFQCCYVQLLCSTHVNQRAKFVRILHHHGLMNCLSWLIRNHPKTKHHYVVKIYGVTGTFVISPFNQLLEPKCKIDIWNHNYNETTNQLVPTNSNSDNFNQIFELLTDYMSVFDVMCGQIRIIWKLIYEHSDHPCSLKKKYTEMDKHMQNIKTSWNKLQITNVNHECK